MCWKVCASQVTFSSRSYTAWLCLISFGLTCKSIYEGWRSCHHYGRGLLLREGHTGGKVVHIDLSESVLVDFREFSLDHCCKEGTYDTTPLPWHEIQMKTTYKPGDIVVITATDNSTYYNVGDRATYVGFVHRGSFPSELPLLDFTELDNEYVNMNPVNSIALAHGSCAGHGRWYVSEKNFRLYRGTKYK